MFFVIALILVGLCLTKPDSPASAFALQKGRISVRTENFPRPPYSGATYYIYERGGETICTKLEVCNKYDQCSTEYRKGSYKDRQDVETGDAYGRTDAVFIPTAKLKKHACLTKFKLVSK